MDQNSKKRKVAESVLDLIENGEILGIGSGSTVNTVSYTHLTLPTKA